MRQNQNAGSVNGATVPIGDDPHGRHPTATVRFPHNHLVCRHSAAFSCLTHSYLESPTGVCDGIRIDSRHSQRPQCGWRRCTWTTQLLAHCRRRSALDAFGEFELLRPSLRARSRDPCRRHPHGNERLWSPEDRPYARGGR
jgi:hypothetical protein